MPYVAAETTDPGFEANIDRRIVDGRPVLTPRRDGERSVWAIALEQAIHQRLPERSLLGFLTGYAYGTDLGATEVARRFADRHVGKPRGRRSTASTGC